MGGGGWVVGFEFQAFLVLNSKSFGGFPGFFYHAEP